MKPIPVPFVLALALLVSGGAAFAQGAVPNTPIAGHLAITPDIGTTFNVGGDFVRSGHQAFSASGTVLDEPFTGTLNISVPKRSFSDVYDQPIQVGLGLSYGLTNYDEVYGRFRWFHADAKKFTAVSWSGTFTFGGDSLSGSGTFDGKFTGYDEGGVDVGYRRFFDTGLMGFYPFVGVLGGVKVYDSVKLTLSSGSTVVADKISFYQGGIEPAVGLDVGFRYYVNPDIALGLETGLRYEMRLQQDTNTTAGAGGLTNINGGGDRLEIPLMATATVRLY